MVNLPFESHHTSGINLPFESHNTSGDTPFGYDRAKKKFPVKSHIYYLVLQLNEVILKNLNYLIYQSLWIIIILFWYFCL